MKSEETIRREYRRLKKIYKSNPCKRSFSSIAYDMATALQWALANPKETDWTPSRIAKNWRKP